MEDLGKTLTNFIVPGMLYNNFNKIRDKRVERYGYSPIEREAMNNMTEQSVETIHRSTHLICDLLPFSLMAGPILGYMISGQTYAYAAALFTLGFTAKSVLVSVAKEASKEYDGEQITPSIITQQEIPIQS